MVTILVPYVRERGAWVGGEPLLSQWLSPQDGNFDKFDAIPTITSNLTTQSYTDLVSFNLKDEIAQLTVEPAQYH
jgi:hypothetical protein